MLQGDSDGYRQVCQRVLERFSGSSDPNILHLVARTCALAPGAVPDRAQPVKLAEKALAARPKLGWFLHTLGLAHYRAGQLEQAVSCFKKSMEVDPGWYHVLDWLPLAMAHFRLGDAEDARRWLAKAVESIDKTPRNPDSTFFLGYSLTDHLECQLLRAEAEALLGIKGKKESGKSVQPSGKSR